MHAKQCKSERDMGSKRSLPRTMTTLVVLKASTDHAVAESQRQRKTQPMQQRVKRSAHGAEQFRTVCEAAFRPDSGEQKIHDARRTRTHGPAGGDSREVCSTAQTSAEIRLKTPLCGRGAWSWRRQVLRMTLPMHSAMCKSDWPDK